ncbi:DNA-binding domain-containing protein [Arenicella xantha]|uniref:Putative DNA-binding protein n=1 Tax=Arenicella xantha TaxID=644221 RepID=A0A395JPG2_9GAMM|nr:DNA-binding domain-containing protein [Arenicella xantha]RBP53540.1 putative DNA-binding protein [Arenicella xantha]
MSQLDAFFEHFATYISTGDASALSPYLSETSNPEFLKVYRNGAFKAGVDALSANFPTLKKVLGDEPFKSLCRSYISENWPSDTRLSSYGDGLSDYIRKCTKHSSDPHASRQVDFAMLDYAWLSSLLARDEAPLSAQSILAILNDNDTQGLDQLQLSSSVRLVQLSGNNMLEWVHLKFNQDGNLNHENSKSLLFWRQDNVVHYRVLNKFEGQFIRTLADSGSIFDAAEAAINAQPNEDVSALFSALLSSGVLTQSSTETQAIL